MNGKRQKNQISLALEPTGRGETPVSGDGTLKERGNAPDRIKAVLAWTG
jgi:hypothetical protein